MCGDCLWVVLGLLLVGELFDEVFDLIWVIEEIVCCYIGKFDFVDLLCKYKIVIFGL